MIKIPIIETERLILRAACEDDFSPYRDFYADAEASAFYGGPLDAGAAWRKFAADLGHWQLHGYGMWTLEVKSARQMVGGCGIVLPYGWPHRELTWWIAPAGRRKGLAFEASNAVLLHAYDEWRWDRVLTYMDDENDPARRLALKLGGKVIERTDFPDGRQRDIYILPRPKDPQ